MDIQGIEHFDRPAYHAYIFLRASNRDAFLLLITIHIFENSLLAERNYWGDELLGRGWTSSCRLILCGEVTFTHLLTYVLTTLTQLSYVKWHPFCLFVLQFIFSSGCLHFFVGCCSLLIKRSMCFLSLYTKPFPYRRTYIQIPFILLVTLCFIFFGNWIYSLKCKISP